MTATLVILGPTASGKSELALALARARPEVELVSADSMQVYVGMDVGTAKPTPAERAEIAHHVVDVVDPAQDYSVADFQAAARAALADVVSRGRVPVIVGGTGLYLRAVIDDLELPGRYPDVRRELEAEADTRGLYRRLVELDPAAATRMEPTNRRRVVRALEVVLGSGRTFSSYGPGLEEYPDVGFRQLGIEPDRPVLDRRIDERFERQLAAGFLEEAAELLARPGGLGRTARQALGYRELFAHLEGGITLTDAVTEAIRLTRRFARRQQRWFRRDPRITWLASDGNPMDLLDAVLEDFDRCG